VERADEGVAVFFFCGRTAGVVVFTLNPPAGLLMGLKKSLIFSVGVAIRF
jgi:hypothetical protein